MKITLSEALAAAAEARAVLGSTAGPETQNKAKTLLGAALDVVSEIIVPKPAPAKAEAKK